MKLYRHNMQTPAVLWFTGAGSLLEQEDTFFVVASGRLKVRAGAAVHFLAVEFVVCAAESGEGKGSHAHSLP